MNCDYTDIRDRIGTPPLWWDENAVPRYCPFTPTETANIYARTVVLALIECQSCATQFPVCLTDHPLTPPEDRLDQLINEGQLHYGDPPNINCCPAGPTMNSIPLRVLEYWTKPVGASWEWARQPEMERDLVAPWADHETSPPDGG